jgi:hypothetical protein
MSLAHGRSEHGESHNLRHSECEMCLMLRVILLGDKRVD